MPNTDLTLLHESVVDDSQIDSLGHMNVRYYVTRAAAANDVLLQQLGIVVDAPGQLLRLTDTYSRFRQEQFAGARLQTYGGLVPLEGEDLGGGIRAYFEIRNVATDALAATLMVVSQPVEIASQDLLPMPELEADVRGAHTVHIPRHGLPRSLSLARPRTVTLAELQAKIPATATPGMMSGRRQNTVLAEDCDAQGRMLEDLDLMFVVYRPQPGDTATPMGPPLLQDDQGRRYSWAMMETRSIVYRRPRAGDVVVSLGADVGLSDRWRQSRRWMFVERTGELLGISDSLGICIDLDARRAIPVPRSVHAEIAANLLPGFL